MLFSSIVGLPISRQYVISYQQSLCKISLAAGTVQQVGVNEAAYALTMTVMADVRKIFPFTRRLLVMAGPSCLPLGKWLSCYVFGQVVFMLLQAIALYARPLSKR